MKNGAKRLFLLPIFLILAQFAFAQNADGSGSSFLATSMLVIVGIIAFAVLVQVADNLMRLEAKKSGVDKSGANFSVFPVLDELTKPKLPKHVNGDAVSILKQGHNILLEGSPSGNIETNNPVTRYAVQPPNFIGMSPIPKVLVEEGDKVKAGDPILFDKKAENIIFVAPVSGEVVAVKRGEKRSIAEVIISADKEQKYKKYKSFDLEKKSREDLVAYLLESGAWPMIRQRPFNVIANPAEVPTNIFISTFDSAPLAPDLNKVVDGKGEAFQKGLDVLAKLTDGAVYLGLNANSKTPPSSVFTDASGIEKHWFHGKHPSGNVGVQIHHAAPMKTTDRVWTLGVQEVLSLGILFLENKYDTTRIVAITGSEIKEAKYVQTYLGANIGELTGGNVKGEDTRMISGDVLSGEQKTNEQFLNFFDDQITAIKEGNYYEMFGWLLPLAPRPSVSRTFPNFLFSDLEFEGDTNMHGEKRAFVMTGQYEKMLPMDVYVQHLMKNIIIGDFERMEGLGIHELVEEDVALCEFACTSKQPLQQILRQGLDMMREQG